MTAEEIMAQDLQRNHPGRQITPESARQQLHHQLATGSLLTRIGNTLFVSRRLPEQGVEFHTINADRASDLVNNVDQYLQQIRRSGAQWAQTYYSNPRITELFFQLLEQNTDWAIAIRPVNENHEHEFTAIIRLET